MTLSSFTRALGFGGALAVAGCASGAETGGEADTVARRLAACVDGRPFYFAASAARAARRTRVGAVHAETPVLSKGGGDAGQIEAEMALSYDLDAAGRRYLARLGSCAPGVRCFPSSATAELFAGDRGLTYDLSIVDTFAPFRGGRAIALAPLDLHGREDGGCPS